MGIAQRQIHIKFSQKTRKQNHYKPLPESIKTVADWIQVKRQEKNLTHSHLAVKMGIATALVRSWEDGISQPDNRQLEMLAKTLRFDPAKYEVSLPFVLEERPTSLAKKSRNGVT